MGLIIILLFYDKSKLNVYWNSVVSCAFKEKIGHRSLINGKIYMKHTESLNDWNIIIFRLSRIVMNCNWQCHSEILSAAGSGVHPTSTKSIATGDRKLLRADREVRAILFAPAEVRTGTVRRPNPA